MVYASCSYHFFARVGNFEITKESGAEHDYIRIKAISGSWDITHRDDSPMYG